ncbi:MAG: 30S ribosomal protein S15 [Fibrobacterota bacterium]
MTKERKAELISKFGNGETDTGNTKVQIAIMTERITELTAHLKTHNKDYATRRGLIKIIGRRKRLLEYLKKKDLEGHKELLKELGIRK